MTRLTEVGTARRDRTIAWVTTGLAIAYVVWMGAYLWRSTNTFGLMYKGLNAELPWPTRFVTDNGWWFYPVVFGVFVLALVVKEVLVEDKRLSTMVSFLIAVAAQFAAHWFTTVYYLPLFELMRNLS